jgi:predicted permease
MWMSVKAGLRALLRGRAVEHELDEELADFMDASAAEKMRRGMAEHDAQRAARIEMGSTNAVKHGIRSVGWEIRMEIFWKDVRQSVRALLRTPGFTAIAVLSLALGIGANAAIFSLLKQVLLAQMPVREPKQLVLFGKSTGGGINGGIDLGVNDHFTYDFAQQLAKAPGPFEGVASYASMLPTTSVRISSQTAATQERTMLVSGNFFSVLGLRPMLGRAIGPADTQTPGSSPVLVVSYRFWQQQLSASPDVLGRAITVNGTTYTIVGVLPEAFQGLRRELSPPDLWLPLTMSESIMQFQGMFQPRSIYFLHMLARRKAGDSLASDQAWLDRQMRDYVKAGEGGNIPRDRQQEIERITSKLTPGAQGVQVLGQQYGDSLGILMGVVGVVLLIACANLANFLLARAVARQRETATRLALGSTRGRIVRQSLVEALVLSLAGGASGIVVAFTASRALIAFVAQSATYTALSPWPDRTVLLFTLGISLAAGVLFGLAPALEAARSGAGPALHAGARTSGATGGRARRLWPRALVTAQIMLSLLLLVAAGLFLGTLRNLSTQDLGFERTQLLLAEFDPHLAGYTPEQVPALNARLIERIEATPGVRGAALSATPPISFGAWHSSIHPAGYTPGPKEDMGSTLNRVSGRYFETVGIPMAVGRAIAPSDTATTMKVAVINQTVANKFYPHGDAVGHMLEIDIDTVEGPWLIVGVARDSKAGQLRSETPRMVYMPLAQIRGKKGEGINDSIANTIEVRVTGDPEKAIASLHAAVASVDPNLPLLRVRTIEQHLEGFMSHEMLISRLTAIFAGLALLLACIGVYGVMSFNVARRNNEIGVRIALGATSGGVQWMVLRESLMLLAVGLMLGLPLTVMAVRLIRAQLFEMSPYDPATFATAVAVLAAITVLAAWIPARRAARVSPMEALRCD